MWRIKGPLSFFATVMTERVRPVWEWEWEGGKGGGLPGSRNSLHSFPSFAGEYYLALTPEGASRVFSISLSPGRRLSSVV